MPLQISGTELKWADDELVKKRLAEKGYNNDEALKDITRSDRTTHVYEGGFKLGCGAGLPGILCALRGAAHVTFHDFNECVVQCYTEENLKLNGIEESRYRLLSGPWNDFRSTFECRWYESSTFTQLRL
ncbi:hypothetical protein OESDEN_20464 [Oesophagostomum dentatum]|uniref:Uncharacterized protein n=1 Tax=Oesophagostomum dentatum TaxID=61180 RepID=A0A0B1S9G4_OESDE|nr:hypothetical protein OESDEN_20464 [Oesophagostomum dentatum]